MTKRTAPTASPTSSNPTTDTPPAAPPASPPESGRQPYETHLAGLPAWQQAALRAHTRWPDGREVTAQEFKQALEQAAGQVIR